MRARYILVLAIVVGVVGLNQLKANSKYVAALATTISIKDAASQDTTADLKTLQQFSTTHMAASQHIFLKDSFARAQSAADAAANPASNGKIYSDAQGACASHADSLVQARCVQAYISAHSQPSANPQPVIQPNRADYTKDYTSPGWTTDNAGLLLLASLVLASVSVVYAIIRRL